MPDLCTLTDVKAWLGITDTNSDTLLTRLITSTSQDFLNEIRRPDLAPNQAWTDHLFSGRDWWWRNLYPSAIGDALHYGTVGKCDIYLRHYPVNSITSVTLDTTPLTAVTDPNDLTQVGFWFDSTLDMENRQKIQLVGYALSGYITPFPNLEIIYNAGYATIPPAIAQAVIEWVAFRRGTSQVQSVNQSGGGFKLGDYERTQSSGVVTLDYLKADIPMSVQSVIDAYRRPVAL